MVPTYLTHAKCLECFHIYGKVFWYKKPTKRCPICNSQLRQVPHGSIEKREYLKKLNTFNRMKQLKVKRVRKWEQKHLVKVKIYKSNYWEANAEIMKAKRIEDGRYFITLQKNSDYQKEHLNEILRKRREKRLILRQMRIPLEPLLISG